MAQLVPFMELNPTIVLDRPLARRNDQRMPQMFYGILLGGCFKARRLFSNFRGCEGKRVACSHPNMAYIYIYMAPTMSSNSNGVGHSRGRKRSALYS